MFHYKFNLKKILFTAFVFCFSPQNTFADPITLEGDFIKIGVNDYGTLGQGNRTTPGIQNDLTGSGNFDLENIEINDLAITRNGIIGSEQALKLLNKKRASLRLPLESL